MSQKKQVGPLQNLYKDIKNILDFVVFKDLETANSYETQETRSRAELYLAAMVQRDTYITYKKWWTIDMFQEVNNSVTLAQFNKYLEKPYSVPLEYRDTLITEGRQAFLDSYVEENTYYRTLTGLPAVGDTNYIYLSDELQKKYKVGNVPVHELSFYIQNQYINTDEYKKVLEDNPDKEYLKYIGMYKVDLYTARNAKDFEIIRYLKNRSDINPYLLNEFPKMYDDSREYVMSVLYNSSLEDTYKNYRTFMAFLILSYTLMRLSNRALESVSTHKYLDDTLIYVILSMYGIPDTLTITKEARRKLAIHLMQLTKEKGTKDVYYDIIKILDYQDIVINKLLLMKGQEFDENGNALDSYVPYFLQVDIRDNDPYESIISGTAKRMSYEEAISGDPTWWDDEEVRAILQNKQYSEADSKFITIEAVIHQMKSLFESIYFSRMIIDNKVTDDFLISIPEIFGTKQVSIYDCIVFIICATCMNNGLSGEITTESEKMLATAGFNFDIDMDSFMEYIDNSDYLEKDRLKEYLYNINIQTQDDITSVFSNTIYPLREWLDNKIAAAENRKEFLEYESVYRALFTYDITNNKILDDFEMPINTLQDEYGLNDNEMEALRKFYPHNLDGSAVTVEQFNESTNMTRYHYPFLSITNPIDWYIHIIVDQGNKQDDRGYLYFYDVLNCDDVRDLRDENNNRIFMDFKDGEMVLNSAAVEKALDLIDKLEEDDLANAYFQVSTKKDDGTYYDKDEKLPAAVRTNVFKKILRGKIVMDTAGLCVPPTSYFEYLYRKNPDLYDVLLDPEADRFNKNKEAWMNDVMSVILAVESALSVHLKYLEQSTVGKDLFFRPLITLIKHFKSLLVEITKTSVKYIFDDKIDAGGNSNMLKLFDESGGFTLSTTIGLKGDESELNLFDTCPGMKIQTSFNDKTEDKEIIVGQGFAAYTRKVRAGSIHMSDEVKFFKNGKPIDSDEESMWYNGTPGDGRWSEEDDVLIQSRTKQVRIKNAPIDFDAWKQFVE